jgi:diguanylate cyclase (GGDEF)-like protein
MGNPTASPDITHSLRRLFARTDDPYAGADVALARRFAVVMAGFATVVVAVLMAFFPPTRTFGELGWVVAGGGYLVSFTIMWVLADKRRAVGFDFLFVVAVLGVGFVAIIQYSAGGRVAPYHELYMFQLIGTALMHPPRRVAGFLAVVVAAMFAPLVYAPGSAPPGEIATELLLWTGMSLVMMILMNTIRAQRLALRREGDEAKRLARVDQLTGLGNRRAFDETLDAELSRSRGAGSPLSLIVSDLNGFKEINDNFGHVLGDDSLRQAATALRGAVRRPDLCFRWGGDEFAVILTGPDAAFAHALATRIETAVATNCTRPDGTPLTLTCGHSALDPEMSVADAVARSDAVLLTLKANDRATSPDATPTPA